MQTKKGLSRATQVATSAAKAILQPWLERLICGQLVACEPSTTPRNKLGFRCTHAWGTGVTRVCRHAGAVPVSVPTAVDGDGSNLVRVMRHVGLFPAHQQQPGADDGALIPPSAVVHVTQSGSAMYGLATPTSDEDYVVQFIAPTRALLGAQALTRRIASHAQVVRVLCSGHGLCLVWLLSHLTPNCVTLLLGVWVGQG